MYIAFFIVGVGLFAGGAHTWSGHYLDGVDSVGAGVAALGLALLVGGIVMAPGW